MRIETEDSDYAIQLIKAGKTVRKINDAINDRDFELAKALVKHLQIAAQLLEQSLNKTK